MRRACSIPAIHLDDPVKGARFLGCLRFRRGYQRERPSSPLVLNLNRPSSHELGLAFACVGVAEYSTAPESDRVARAPDKGRSPHEFPVSPAWTLLGHFDCCRMTDSGSLPSRFNKLSFTPETTEPASLRRVFRRRVFH